MELNIDQGFVIQNGVNGKTEVLINHTHLRGVFIGVRSSIKLSKMFTPGNFDPFICMLATLKYLLPEFANKFMVVLKRKSNGIGLGIIEAISPENIIRVMKEKVPDYNKLARIQLSTKITDPQSSEQIKVNIYILVSGKAPLRYVFVDPNGFKDTSIDIIKNQVPMALRV